MANPEAEEDFEESDDWEDETDLEEEDWELDDWEDFTNEDMS